jgi:hypothetical protein
LEILQLAKILILCCKLAFNRNGVLNKIKQKLNALAEFKHPKGFIHSGLAIGDWGMRVE